jgi:HK97 family phage portal protein
VILDHNGNDFQTSLSVSDNELKKDLNRDASQYSEWNFVINPTVCGSMSYKMLRTIYTLSSAVRPAVDSIAREVSTLPYKIVNKDLHYHDPKKYTYIIDFFEEPNLDDEDLSTILSKFVTDLLVIGKGVIEKVRNPQGKILELVARDASLYQPIVNKQGFITGYQEYDRVTFLPKTVHKKENIIFKYFTPMSYTFGAAPIIETIVNEISLLMLCVKAIAWAFTKDEIPPGVLHLGIIGEEALARAKASFEATKGIIGQSKLRVVDNVDKVDWVPFTHAFREMQVAELMPMIERIVARNFGLSPVESSLSDVARGVADASFRSSQSKLIFPLMQIIGNSLNRGVIKEFDSDYKLIWSRIPQEDFNTRASGLGQLLDRGIITDNEARLPLGYDPVKGGDTRSVKLGNERVPLDETTGKPIYRNPVNPGQSVKPNKTVDITNK